MAWGRCARRKQLRHEGLTRRRGAATPNSQPSSDTSALPITRPPSLPPYLCSQESSLLRLLYLPSPPSTSSLQHHHEQVQDQTQATSFRGSSQPPSNVCHSYITSITGSGSGRNRRGSIGRGRGRRQHGNIQSVPHREEQHTGRPASDAPPSSCITPSSQMQQTLKTSWPPKTKMTKAPMPHLQQLTGSQEHIYSAASVARLLESLHHPSCLRSRASASLPSETRWDT